MNYKTSHILGFKFKDLLIILLDALEDCYL